MRRLSLIVWVVAGLASCGLAVAAPAELPAWLAGCWAFERDGLRVEEQWMAPEGGLMLGMSRTMRQGSAVEWEFLLIRRDGEDLVLVASPSGQATTSFRLASLTRDEVVFANPGHDFPQRIAYRLGSAGALTARVEGTLEGARKGLDFPYRPVPCPGHAQAQKGR